PVEPVEFIVVRRGERRGPLRRVAPSFEAPAGLQEPAGSRFDALAHVIEMSLEVLDELRALMRAEDQGRAAFTGNDLEPAGAAQGGLPAAGAASAERSVDEDRGAPRGLRGGADPAAS